MAKLNRGCDVQIDNRTNRMKKNHIKMKENMNKQ